MANPRKAGVTTTKAPEVLTLPPTDSVNGAALPADGPLQLDLTKDKDNVAAGKALPAPTVVYDRSITVFAKNSVNALKAFDKYEKTESGDKNVFFLVGKKETIKVTVSDKSCVGSDTYMLPDGSSMTFHLVCNPAIEAELLQNAAVTILARKRKPSDKDDAKALKDEFWAAIESYQTDFSWIVPEAFAKSACLLKGMTADKAKSLAKRCEGANKSDLMEAVKDHSMKYGVAIKS